MEKYEITIITKEPFDTAHGKDTKDTPVKKEIESLGGKILNVQSLGQKQMAYQIKKETAGFYTVITLEIDPTKVLELNKKFGLKQEILRHLILVAKAAKTEVPRVRKEVVETKTITPEVEEKPKEEIPEPLQEPVE
ncbi:MAG: ribosomal protein, partial [Candidatus Berkelbacteria bacterium]|nr:ribosomal protein [Candidatus Berkelbacteria bacterium]